MRRLPIVAALGLALAAGAAAHPARHGAWRTHLVSPIGLSLQTPATWVDLTTATPGMLDNLVKSEPSLASLVKVTETNKLVKLLCVEPDGAANVDVVEARRGPARSGRS
jgi:hypothetical protein